MAQPGAKIAPQEQLAWMQLTNDVLFLGNFFANTLSLLDIDPDIIQAGRVLENPLLLKEMFIQT